jgi:hypothetical protein
MLPIKYKTIQYNILVKSQTANLQPWNNQANYFFLERVQYEVTVINFMGS